MRNQQKTPSKKSGKEDSQVSNSTPDSVPTDVGLEPSQSSLAIVQEANSSHVESTLPVVDTSQIDAAPLEGNASETGRNVCENSHISDASHPPQSGGAASCDTASEARPEVNVPGSQVEKQTVPSAKTATKKKKSRLAANFSKPVVK